MNSILPDPSGSGGRSAVRALLQVPLAAKLVGANVFIFAAACTAATLMGGGRGGEGRVLVFAGALLGSVAANVGLIVLALRPLGDLEQTAARIWRGDLSARVPQSPLADRDMQRVGGALNVVLDGLAADRSRLRELAARVIRAGDEERSYIARELHDSSAQSLAALLMELSVVTRETDEPAALARLERIRRIASDVLDEVRMLAQSVHPRVLDDLGLGAALQHLAREAEVRSTVRIEVAVADATEKVDASVASVLYRVAQEALNNALRHANATTVLLHASVVDHLARVEIRDDGVGFWPAESERQRPGMGIFTMRERLALLDGTLDIESAPGRGTRVIAAAPLLHGVAAVASRGPRVT